MIIQPDALNIRPTDKVFDDSADTGSSDCLCNRCGNLIMDEEMPVRLYTTNEAGKVNENSKEYRFCEYCTTGKKYFKCETFDEMGFCCDDQCNHCKNVL